MESYYDSEEEIAWGPITLREIKADFKRPVVRIPNKRHTTVGSFQMDSFMDSETPEPHSEDSSALSQEVVNNTNVSETSTQYYTPNESLRSERNSGFLEKLSKVINNPQTESSAYTSALENTKTSVTTEIQSKNESFKSALSHERTDSPYVSLVGNKINAEDSCLNFLKVAAGHNTVYDIANFQQSLVENTISLSDDEKVVADELDYSDSEDSFHEELKCKNRHTLVQKTMMLSPEAENIIVISDDEESLLLNDSVVYNELDCETFLIKKENDSENEMYEKKYEMEKIEEEEEVSHNSSSNSISCEENQQDKIKCDPGNSHPEIHPETEDKEFLSASSITIPEIDLKQFDDSSSQTDSPQFNDTLEEMNRLLNQVLKKTIKIVETLTLKRIEGDEEINPLIEEKNKLTTVPFIIPKIIVTRYTSISKRDTLEIDDTFDNLIELSEETPISEIVETESPDFNSKNDSVQFSNNLNDDGEILKESPCCSSAQSCPVGDTVPQVYPTIEGQEPLTTSLTTYIPEIITNECHDFISKNDSLELDDTIEEMNRALKQGLDYTMSEDDSIIEDTPVKGGSINETTPVKGGSINEDTPVKRGSKLNAFKPETPCNIISGSFTQTPSNNSFLRTKEKGNRIPVRKFQQTVASESRQHNRYNLVTTSPSPNFKVPVTPVRTKHANPTPPKSSSNHLKNIVSPVALYIKNSPSIPLKQNVPQRELSKIVTTKTSKCASKENYPELPEVVYKPAKKQITSKEKEITLPPSFKKLNIKEPVIIKHEGRIKQNMNKPKANSKLLQNDITNSSLNASVLNSSSDISVLTNKQAYIK